MYKCELVVHIDIGLQLIHSIIGASKKFNEKCLHLSHLSIAFFQLDLQYMYRKKV